MGGVDSESDNNGKEGKVFFYDAEDFATKSGFHQNASASGTRFLIDQYRNDEQIWSGECTLKRAGPDGHGFRCEGKDWGQWEVDDKLVVYGGSVNNKKFD